MCTCVVKVFGRLRVRAHNMRTQCMLHSYSYSYCTDIVQSGIYRTV